MALFLDGNVSASVSTQIHSFIYARANALHGPSVGGVASMIVGESLRCCMQWSPDVSLVRWPVYIPSWGPAGKGTLAKSRRPPSTAGEVAMETSLLSLDTCACMNCRCGYMVGSLELVHMRLISLKVSMVIGDGKGIDGVWRS